jgi:hypothetical protein
MVIKIVRIIPINVVLSNQFIHDLKLLSHVYKLLTTKKRFQSLI